MRTPDTWPSASNSNTGSGEPTSSESRRFASAVRARPVPASSGSAHGSSARSVPAKIASTWP